MVAGLLLAGVALAIDAGWIHAKAALAQQLLHVAWRESNHGASARKPWPWADTHPVARLRVPELGIDQIVLAGDSGRSLAFGPGWAEGSAIPGARGTSVISGHRDTHFAFLETLRENDRLLVESVRGLRQYRVEATRVADTRFEQLRLDGPGDGTLVLVTCYPFDAIAAGGPLRYVVMLRPVPIGDAVQSSRVAATSTPSPSA
jgi:sortase A